MTEIPRVFHNKVNHPEQEGDTIVPEETTQESFPIQQTPNTAVDAYPKVLHEAEPEKKSKLKLILGMIAAGIAASVAFGATAYWSADNQETPKGPTPTVSGEQFPGTTTVSTPNTADTYGASPEHSVTERVRVNGKDYSIDEARKQLFTISVTDAPTFEEAAKKYLTSVQTAMNMNTDRGTISDLGNSKEAAAKMNLDLLTGEDSILLGLGAKLNKVSSTGLGKRLEPGTLAYHRSVENINEEKNSELVSLPGTQRITGDEAAGYMLRETGFVTQKEQGSGAALKSDQYDIEIHGKKTATGTWDFSGSVFAPFGK